MAGYTRSNHYWTTGSSKGFKQTKAAAKANAKEMGVILDKHHKENAQREKMRAQQQAKQHAQSMRLQALQHQQAEAEADKRNRERISSERNNALMLANHLASIGDSIETGFNNTVNELQSMHKDMNSFFKALLETEDSEKKRLAEIQEGINWFHKGSKDNKLYSRALKKFLIAYEIDNDDILVTYHLAKIYELSENLFDTKKARFYYEKTKEVVVSVDKGDENIRADYIEHINYLTSKLFKIQNFEKKYNKDNQSKLTSTLDDFISKTYFEENNMQLAIKHSHQSVKNYGKKEINNTTLKKHNLNNIWLAKCYSEANNINKAIDTLNPVLYKYPEFNPLIAVDESFDKKEFVTLLSKLNKKLQTEAKAIIDNLSSIAPQVKTYTNTINSDNPKKQIDLLLEYYKGLYEVGGSYDYKTIQRSYTHLNGINIEYFFPLKNENKLSMTEKNNILKNILFELEDTKENLLKLDEKSQMIVDKIQELKDKNEKILSVIEKIKETPNASKEEIKVLKSGVKNIPDRLVPYVRNFKLLDTVNKELVGEYISLKTKNKKRESIELSVKEFTEKVFPQIQNNFKKTQDQNTAEVLDYVNQFQKHLMQENREFILSCIN